MQLKKHKYQIYLLKILFNFPKIPRKNSKKTLISGKLNKVLAIFRKKKNKIINFKVIKKNII
jgi:hypothetical protein